MSSSTSNKGAPQCSYLRAIRHVCVGAVVLLLGVALAACGGQSSGSRGQDSELLQKNGLPVHRWEGVVPGYLTVHIEIESLPGLGSVLVDDRGRVYYAFRPDKQRAVMCAAGCAWLWHPLTLNARQALDITPSLDYKLLGGVSGPHGSRVVSFDGWPLYTYAGERQTGSANGEEAYSHGGHWYALSPSGSLVARQRGSRAVGNICWNCFDGRGTT